MEDGEREQMRKIDLTEWSIDLKLGEQGDWVVDVGDGDDPNEVTAKVTLPLERCPGWNVTVELQRIRDRVEPVGFYFSRNGEPFGVGGSTSIFKALRISELQETIVADMHGPMAPLLPVEWRTTTKITPRPGRARRTATDYALLVQEYLAACEAHGRVGAVKAVASDRGVSPKTIYTMLGAAQRETAWRPQLLTGVHHGRQGGEMTPACKRLLGIKEAD
jgi:hypothetical protein